MDIYTMPWFIRDILKPQSGTQSGTGVSPKKLVKNYNFIGGGKYKEFFLDHNLDC